MKVPSLQSIFLWFLVIVVLSLISNSLVKQDWFHFQFKSNDSDISKIRNSRVTLCYKLDKEKWTNFPIPQKTNRLRILTHVDLDASLKDSPDQTFFYSIDYECLNTKQEVLKEGVYHHRVQFNWSIDLETGQRVKKSFYLDEDKIPSSQSLMLLDLSDIDETVTEIRFKLNGSDEWIEGAVIRSYYWEAYDRLRPLNQWHRLSRHQKETLAAGNVYEYSFLSREEKINLMQASWRPFGPRGIEGKDYILQKMYIEKDFDGIPEDQVREETEVNSITPERHFIMELPLDGMNLRIFAQKLDSPLGEHKIEWRWYDRKDGSQKIGYWNPSNNKENYFEKHWDAGLLELRSKSSTFLSFMALSDSQWIDYYPQLPTLRCFFAKPGQALEYKINHLDDGLTAFRFSMRIPHESELKNLSSDIVTELVAQDGSILKREKTTIFPELSEYDFIKSIDGTSSTTESSNLYYRITSEVDRIRIYSSREILVSGFNRIFKSPRVVQVPDDQNSSEQSEKLPVWFFIKPNNWHQLQFTNQSAILYYRPSPNKKSDDILRGNYEVDSLISDTGDGSGRTFYFPHVYDKINKKEILGILYHPLINNKELELYIDHSENKPLVNPTLLLSHSKTNTPLSIFWNGNWIDHVVRHKKETIALPTVKRGNQILHIKGNAMHKSWLNYHVNEGDALIKRFVQKANPKMKFSFSKTREDMAISFHYISEKLPTKAFHFDMELNPFHIETNSASEGHTVQRRKIILNPENAEEVFALHTEKRFFKLPVFFYTLQSDLPNSEYILSLNGPKSNNGYILVQVLRMEKDEKINKTIAK